MEINVYFRTYNAYGGHVTLTLTGGYLTLDAPSFGDAIEEIEVIVHFRSDGPPRKTLESMYDIFHAGLSALPKVTFRRKKRKAELSFYSELLTAREVERSRQLSLDLFCNGCREVVKNVKLLRRRIRKDDAFDFAEFQSWLDQRVERLPRTIDELTAIQSEIEAHRKSARESLTEWERTGIDFDDFHPDARSVLDDPRLWDVCDDWAPNGNDTGADVLELYRDWRKRNRKTKAETFFKQLMQGWEVRLPPDPADEYSTHTYHQAIVGLAFAQLKLHAQCDPPIASLALQSLEAQPEHDLTNKLKSVLQKWI
jgi:uncharacterized protein YfeS